MVIAIQIGKLHGEGRNPPFPPPYQILKVHVPNFGGCQGRRTGVGVTTVSNSLILGGWVTKVLNNGDKE